MVVAPPQVLYDFIPEEFYQVCLVGFLAENVMHDCVELDGLDTDSDHVFGFFCVVNQVKENCFISLIVVFAEMVATLNFLRREEFFAFLFLDNVNPMKILDSILVLKAFFNLFPESSEYLFD